LRPFVPVDQVQAAFDARLRAAGPERRMRLHTQMYQDALRLVWAQADRAAPMSELQTARFLLRRLYPDLEGERLESLMTRLSAEFEAGTWTGFRRRNDGADTASR
jgi:hypothetical protein